MVDEELIREALAITFIAPADDDLNWEKIDFAELAELDQKSGDGAEPRRTFKKCDLVRVEVVKIQRFSPGSFGVEKNRASIRSERPAVIRLGFRLRHEATPVRDLVFFYDSIEFG